MVDVETMNVMELRKHSHMRDFLYSAMKSMDNDTLLKLIEDWGLMEQFDEIRKFSSHWADWRRSNNERE